MSTTRSAKQRLLTFALSLPGAWEAHPWGETVAKVGKKVFVFFGHEDTANLFVGVKLPASLLYARTLPFTQKFGYGLDRADWITARFSRDDEVPIDLLEEWIEESYRAVAPKSLSRSPCRAARPRRRSPRAD